MNPLAFLLGQQSTGGMPGPISGYGGGTFNMDGSVATPVEGDPIVVQNWTPEDMPRQGLPDENYTLDNSRDIQMRDEALRRGEEVSDRRGMFGMKGTLRDVVGVLGDAFLMQSGNNPIYAPTRQQERFSDAMAGASQRPMAAYERAMGINPKAAQDFYDANQDNEIARAQAESLAASRQDMADNRSFQQFDKAQDIISGIFSQPGAFLPDGSINPAALQLAETVARQSNRTLEDFVGEEISPEALRMFGTAGMSAYQQGRLPQFQQQADAATSNAQSSRIRANRAPTPRQPRAESDREAAIRIGNKPEAERTPGEQAFYKKYTTTGSSRGGTRDNDTAPSGGSLRPRNPAANRPRSNW